jgi:hypothetical protein
METVVEASRGSHGSPNAPSLPNQLESLWWPNDAPPAAATFHGSPLLPTLAVASDAVRRARGSAAVTRLPGGNGNDTSMSEPLLLLANEMGDTETAVSGSNKLGDSG